MNNQDDSINDTIIAFDPIAYGKDDNRKSQDFHYIAKIESVNETAYGYVVGDGASSANDDFIELIKSSGVKLLGSFLKQIDVISDDECVKALQDFAAKFNNGLNAWGANKDGVNKAAVAAGIINQDRMWYWAQGDVGVFIIHGPVLYAKSQRGMKAWIRRLAGDYAVQGKGPATYHLPLPNFKPEVKRVELEPGDIVWIASDGLNEQIEKYTSGLGAKHISQLDEVNSSTEARWVRLLLQLKENTSNNYATQMDQWKRKWEEFLDEVLNKNPSDDVTLLQFAIPPEESTSIKDQQGVAVVPYGFHHLPEKEREAILLQIYGLLEKHLEAGQDKLDKRIMALEKKDEKAEKIQESFDLLNEKIQKLMVGFAEFESDIMPKIIEMKPLEVKPPEEEVQEKGKKKDKDKEEKKDKKEQAKKEKTEAETQKVEADSTTEEAGNVHAHAQSETNVTERKPEKPPEKESKFKKILNNGSKHIRKYSIYYAALAVVIICICIVGYYTLMGSKPQDDAKNKEKQVEETTTTSIRDQYVGQAWALMSGLKGMTQKIFIDEISDNSQKTQLKRIKIDSNVMAVLNNESNREKLKDDLSLCRDLLDCYIQVLLGVSLNNNQPITGNITEDKAKTYKNLGDTLINIEKDLKGGRLTSSAQERIITDYRNKVKNIAKAPTNIANIEFEIVKELSEFDLVDATVDIATYSNNIEEKIVNKWFKKVEEVEAKTDDVAEKVALKAQATANAEATQKAKNKAVEANATATAAAKATATAEAEAKTKAALTGAGAEKVATKANQYLIIGGVMLKKLYEKEANEIPFSTGMKSVLNNEKYPSVDTLNTNRRKILDGFIQSLLSIKKMKLIGIDGDITESGTDIGRIQNEFSGERSKIKFTSGHFTDATYELLIKLLLGHAASLKANERPPAIPETLFNLAQTAAKLAETDANNMSLGHYLYAVKQEFDKE